jgi:hypothetical protein
MKLIRFIGVCALFLIVFACTNEHPIVGNWKLDGVDIEKAIATIPDEQKDFARKMMSSAFDQVKGKMKLEFKKDGKFKIETPVQDGKINSQNGQWDLSKDNSKLTTTVEGKKETIGVVELSETKLVLSMTAPGQGEMQMTFIPK